MGATKRRFEERTTLYRTTNGYLRSNDVLIVASNEQHARILRKENPYDTVCVFGDQRIRGYQFKTVIDDTFETWQSSTFVNATKDIEPWWDMVKSRIIR